MNDLIERINSLISAAADDIYAIRHDNPEAPLFQRDANNNLALAKTMALASIAESLAKLASTVSNYEDAAIRVRQG